MIAIRNADTDTAQSFCQMHGLPMGDVYQMCDGTDILGTACICCKGEQGAFVWLQAPSVPLTDALLRAALNAALAKGVQTMAFEEDVPRNFMINKGYFLDTAQTELKIADFFGKSCCNG